MSLEGEKSTKGVGKWSLKGERPREEALTRFFLSGGLKDAKQPGKKGESLEGSRKVGGRELIQARKGGRGSEEAKPCLIRDGCDNRRGEMAERCQNVGKGMEC